ncbi:MAG: aspartate carbamoyltransferase catalytic subunit [Candidatus Kapaibacterium sp.]
MAVKATMVGERLAATPEHSANGKGKPVRNLSGNTGQRRDLLGIEQLPKDTILDLIERSQKYYQELLGKDALPARTILNGRTVGNLFFENSTRTRISFELAEKRLGATHVTLTPSASSLTKGESLLDTVRVVEAMKLDCIVVRHSASGVPEFLAKHLPDHVHLINAGDGAHEHPTQGLLDAASLMEVLGDLSGKKIVIIGDITHSRVARSNVWLLKKLGAAITLVGPHTLLPRHAEEVFGVHVRHDLGDSLKEADAVMALRIQHERQSSAFLPSLEEYQTRYGLTEARISATSAVILHPGPINLGVELGEGPAYGTRSLVLKQVKRGVAVRMAVLEWLFS